MLNIIIQLIFFSQQVQTNLKKKQKTYVWRILGHLGLEPRTIRLKAEYSTIELVTLAMYNSLTDNQKIWSIRLPKSEFLNK